MAAMSARWTQETLLPQHLEWLRALPQGPVRGDDSPDAEFVHGSPRDEDEYVLNPTTASFNFRLPGHADRIFFGHTHIQGGFTYRNGKTQPFAPQYETGEDVVQFSMTLAPEERYLINPARWDSHAMATGAPPLRSTRPAAMRPPK